MMNFSFSEQNEVMRNQLRKFAVKELLPKYTYWDRKKEFPEIQLKKMCDLGLFGLRIEEKYGGSNEDYVTVGVAIEEIARGDFNCASYPLVYSFIGELFSRFAETSIKDDWLPLLAKGKKRVVMGLTEPSSGSDAAALIATAKTQGDSYILNGEKSSISFLNGVDAILVFARLDGIPGYGGIRGFLVPTDAEGITIQTYDSMGARPLDRGSLFMDDVRIPLENCITKEGFKVVMNGFDFSRALLALQCLGAAEISLEETIAHTKVRKTFNKPLAANQGVSFPIAEYYTYLEAAKLLCYKTLWMRDNGIEHTKEAAMCKWWGPKLAADIIHGCLLLHGHYGYTSEYPIEQRLRDVIGVEIGDGAPQIQKIVIARRLIGDECRH